MTRPRRRRRAAGTVLLILCTALATLAGSASGASTAWKLTPVTTGLDSPRGLAFTADGNLLVAEAGHGGDVCVPSPLGPHCTGLTSQISTVDTTSGTHTPLVTGLYSRSVQMEGITGIDGIAVNGGRTLGAITAYPQELSSLTCNGQPADCPQVLAAARAQAGQLIELTSGGSFKPVAGLGSHDFGWAASNPGFSKEPPNSNPYGVFTSLSGGAYVADAGANLLVYVAPDGTITEDSALAPPAPGGFPADTVPTCVTVMRGNLYAGSLSGRLWKRGGSFTPTEVPVTDASGKSLLHHVTGCVSDDKTGTIYLVDMWGTPGPPIPAGPQSAAGTGSVIALSAKGAATVLASGLDFPNGIARAKDGSLYVTVGSTCTAVGTPFPYCAKGGGIIRLQAP